MGRRLIDLTGERYGRLTVRKYLGRQHHSSYWLCDCDCGSQTKVQAGALKNGTIIACGCARRERAGKLNLKHTERGAKEKTVEYRCWLRIIERCANQTGKESKWYFHRGIRVCEEWCKDFGAFLREIGPKPTRYHSLDRIDGSRGYEPGNVRWATWNEQARNRSNNRRVQFVGKTVVLVEAAELAGIPYKTVKARLGKGWTVQEALETKVNRNKVVAAQRNNRASRCAAA
jgi:hypothetical protein